MFDLPTNSEGKIPSAAQTAFVRWFRGSFPRRNLRGSREVADSKMFKSRLKLVRDASSSRGYGIDGRDIEKMKRFNVKSSFTPRCPFSTRDGVGKMAAASASRKFGRIRVRTFSTWHPAFAHIGRCRFSCATGLGMSCLARSLKFGKPGYSCPSRRAVMSQPCLRL